MNRLNARIQFWYNVAEACIHPLCMDREGYKHAAENHMMYCYIRDAIRRPGRRAD